MRRSALSTCAALTLLALPGTAAGQATSLTFRDDRPLTVASADLAAPATAARLKVCNTGSRPLTGVHAAAEGFGFTSGGKPVADGAELAPAKLRATGGRLAPGVCRSVALAPATGAPRLDPGSYQGVVTVVAPRAGLVRRSLTVTGTAAAAPRTVVPESVTSTVKIKVVHNGFSPLGGGHADQTRYVTLKAPPAGSALQIAGHCTDPPSRPSPLCPAIGVVAHDEDTAQLSIGGPTPKPSNGVVRLPVLIQGAGVVGDYQGTIDPGATGRPDDAIAVTVSVTDAWWCALIALLLGCLVALLPQLVARRWNPKSKVKGEAEGLIRCYRSAVESFRAAGPPSFPQILAPTEDEVTAYADEIKAAVDTYMKSMVFLDMSTPTFAEIQASIANARSDAACWHGPGGMHGALNQLQAALDDLQDWLGSHDFAPKGPAVCRTAARVLAARKLEIGEAGKVKADADKACALVADWRKLATRVLVLQLWWRAIAQTPATLRGKDAERFLKAAARIIQCKRELVRAADAAAIAELGVKARVTAVYEDLAYLGGRLDVGEPSPDADPGVLDGQWGALGIAESDARWLRQERGATVPTVAAIVGAASAVERAPARVASVGRTWRILGDVFCIVLAILVAIVGSMLTLVSGKNFGSAGDYLTVIVVGAAAQATISSLVPKFNTFLSDLLGAPLEKGAKPAVDL